MLGKKQMLGFLRQPNLQDMRAHFRGSGVRHLNRKSRSPVIIFTLKAMESLLLSQLLIEGYGFSTAYLSGDRSN